MDYLLVFIGGGLGSMLRLVVGKFFAQLVGTSWPFGTLFINLTGSFAIALFLTLAAERWGLPPSWRYFVATGVIGGYTTFSTFEYETQRLIELGTPGYAVLYVIASVLVGAAAAFAGVFIGRRA